MVDDADVVAVAVAADDADADADGVDYYDAGVLDDDDADTDDDMAVHHFKQNARDLRPADEQIVGPLELGFRSVTQKMNKLRLIP